MPKKTTVLPTSIRRGQLQPSQRYEAPGAKSAAMRTNWRLGIDVPQFESTSQAASKQSGNVPPEVLALRQPRIVKNGSDKGAISGDNPTNPNMYKTTYVSEFRKDASVMSSEYVKGKPAFDRKSANKTNYEIAPSKSHHDLRTTSHVHHANPTSWNERKGFEKSVIGGWTKPNGDYCVDEASRGSVMRGGGGGEGSLGVRFNVVTNQPDPKARDNAKIRSGPRVSCNVKDPWLEGANQYGEQVGSKVNLLSGKLRPNPVIPNRPTPESLKRPDVDGLRTRPW